MQGTIHQPTTSTDESCTNYRSQIDNVLHWAGVAYWEYDVAADRFKISSIFLAAYGYNFSDFSTLSTDFWKAIIHPDDLSLAIATLEQVAAGHADFIDTVYRMRTASGEWRYFRSKGRVSETAPEGTISRLAGTLQDISDLKAADVALARRDRLLSAVNEIASILLAIEPNNFDQAIASALCILGTEAEVDRVYVWENERAGNIEYSTQTYEWSPYAEPQIGTEYSIRIKPSEVTPTLAKCLFNGIPVNELVRNLPKLEQQHLLPQRIVSILIAPIMFRGEFWGSLGFDDCQHERVWDTTEIGILKSAGMMIASAIQQHKIVKDLHKERKILNRIIETSPIAILTVTDGLVSQVNRKGQILFDILEGTPTAQIYANIIGKHERSFSRSRILQEMRDKGVFFRHNVQYLCRDGNVHDFFIVAIPLEIQNIRRAIIWIIDVTDLKDAERALIQAKNTAETATHAKSDFLARMSHEIRTPMNAILGMIYLCLQTTLTAKQMDYLTKTQSAANNLLGIINDILDFSKIEAGKFELELISFSLQQTITEVFDTIKHSAEKKGLVLDVNIDTGVCDNLVGDPLRLRQILLNLLSNSIKFTETGGISVSVKQESSWHHNNSERVRLMFEVSDTGIGLKPEQAATVFDSFAQADGSTTRKYGGTGLGLAIVKSFVNLMEGDVSVKSRFGEGAVFSFTAVFTKSSIEPEISSVIAFSRRRVMIIDDNEDDLEVMISLMQSFHTNTSSVSSGQVALDMLAYASKQGVPFELVLIDWRMPRIDGIETVRQIRQNEKITQPHILMVSAYDRQECLRQTQGLDVADVLVKPISPQVLKATLKTIFQENVSGKIAEKRADIQGAKILLAEDNKINQLVASELLTIMQVNVTVANNGLEAVEAVKKNEFDLILMDIQMPEMDGLEAAKIIRQLNKPEAKKIPILAMTANAMDTDYQKSLDVGMNDHLTKPIDPDRLRLALEKWIVE